MQIAESDTLIRALRAIDKTLGRMEEILGAIMSKLYNGDRKICQAHRWRRGHKKITP